MFGVYLLNSLSFQIVWICFYFLITNTHIEEPLEKRKNKEYNLYIAHYKEFVSEEFVNEEIVSEVIVSEQFVSG